MSYSYVVTRTDAPSAYFENWADCIGEIVYNGDVVTLLKTHRTDAHGVSDAQYIRDRLTSGLYWARVFETADAVAAEYHMDHFDGESYSIEDI